MIYANMQLESIGARRALQDCCRRRQATVLLAAALGVLVASGCTKISTQTSTARGNPWTIPGVLRIGIRNEPDNLNPVLGQQQIDVDISTFWAGYLFNYDDQGRLVPELASDVPSLQNGGISRDGRTVTYHLRSGIRWQDGVPFTADDVIFTWHAVMNRNNPVASRVGYELVESIEKRGDRTLVVHLSRPDAPFVGAFLTTVGAYAYCVLPKHLFAQGSDLNHAPYNLSPIGTGPYRVIHYEPHNLVRLIANNAYWRGPPALREIDIRVIPNDNTLATLVRTHEIDFYYRVPHVISRTLRGQKGIAVVSTPFNRFADIGFNTENPILSAVLVRQALAYATDKKAIVDKVTAGDNVVADSDQAPFSWAFNRRVFRYAYDPAKAGRLLDSAGWRLGPDGYRRKNGKPLRLGLAGIAGDATFTATRELLQAQWRQVGVDADLKSYPSDILYASLPDGGIEMTGHYDTVLESFANGVDPDDSVLFECRWRPPAGENVYRFCNPALDAAEEKALTTLDARERKTLYDRIQDIEMDQLPILPLWFESYDYALNSDVRKFRPARVGTPFWNAWTWQI